MNNLLRSAALERPFAFQGPIGSTNSVTATPAGAAVVNGGLRIEIPVRRSPRPRRPRLPLEFVRELAGGNPTPVDGWPIFHIAEHHESGMREALGAGATRTRKAVPTFNGARRVTR